MYLHFCLVDFYGFHVGKYTSHTWIRNGMNLSPGKKSKQMSCWEFCSLESEVCLVSLKPMQRLKYQQRVPRGDLFYQFQATFVVQSWVKTTWYVARLCCDKSFFTHSSPILQPLERGQSPAPHPKKSPAC